MTNDPHDEDAFLANKVRCVGLMMHCPLDRYAKNCPFHKLREEESVVTRVNQIKNSDAANLKRMLHLHESCLAQPAGT